MKKCLECGQEIVIRAENADFNTSRCLECGQPIPNKEKKVLEMLEDKSVFSIEKNNDGTFEVIEECDRYFSVTLTSKELEKLGLEIKELTINKEKKECCEWISSDQEYSETKSTLHLSTDPLTSLLQSASEEFEKGCNADNISDPPSDLDWILAFIASKLTEAFNKGKENKITNEHIENQKDCCCESYRQGITPCLCNCHSKLGEQKRQQGYREAVEMVKRWAEKRQHVYQRMEDDPSNSAEEKDIAEKRFEEMAGLLTLLNKEE